MKLKKNNLKFLTVSIMGIAVVLLIASLIYLLQHRELNVSINDFEQETVPLRDYGVVDAGSIQEEQGNHFFRLLYSQSNTKHIVGSTSPHSGYLVESLPAIPKTASVLTFRYRTDGISDLRLSLNFKHQSLSWFLKLTLTNDWAQIQLPIYKQLSKPLIDETVESLHITTFATVPETKNSTFLDLDDFCFHTEKLPQSTIQRVETKLTEKAEALDAIRKYVVITNLHVTVSTYPEGEKVQLKYDIMNTGKDSIQIPLNNNDCSQPMRLLGIIQAWIEPLDDYAKTTDFGRSAKKGNKYAAGGSILPFRDKVFKSGQLLHKNMSISKELSSGRYKYYLEFKSIDSSAIINEETVQFTIVPK